jgi:hypothetical protein
MAKKKTHTADLLKRVVEDFPRKRERLHGGVPDEYAELVVDAPGLVGDIPTFDAKFNRPLSLMLRDRFEFASKIVRFSEEWLNLDTMAQYIRRREVQAMHASHRKHWEGSAPMLFPDRNLGLFCITHGVPENIVYLVWKDSDDEPELWKYSGMNSRVFKNLEKLLEWYLV